MTNAGFSSAIKRTDETSPGAPATGGLPSEQSGGLALCATSAAGLVILVFAAFVPALQAGFVLWDDDDLLLGPLPFRSLTGESIRWMFSTSFAGHFQPLTWLSYAVDFAIWQGDPLGYHFTNVLLHALTALAFLAVSRRLLALAFRDAGGWASRSVHWGAVMAAVLFAVHPLRAESVAWLAERRDVLSGVWFMLAVYCYLRYAEHKLRPNDAGTSAQRGWFAGAVALCAVSLLAKASAMMLPLVLIILDVYPLRRIGEQVRWPQFRNILLEKVPFVILAAAAALRALLAQEAAGALYGAEAHGWLERAAQAVHGLWFYPARTLIPAGLGPLYEIPSRGVLLGPLLWWRIIALIGVGVVLWRWRRRTPGIVAALTTYVALVAPVLGLAQSGPQLVADRYSYLSCLGFAVLGGAGLTWLLRRPAGRRAEGRALIGLGGVLVVVVLTRLTLAQTDIWRSPLSLWSRGVAVSPESAVAHVNYADALAGAGMYEGAIEHYRRGLALDPRDAIALDHYAVVMERLGETEAAIGLYLQALRVDPNRRAACFALGRLLYARGRVRDAIAVLQDGFRRHGADDPAMLLLLADAYAEIGEFKEARATALQALTLIGAAHEAALKEAITTRLEHFERDEVYPKRP